MLILEKFNLSKFASMYFYKYKPDPIFDMNFEGIFKYHKNKNLFNIPLYTKNRAANCLFWKIFIFNYPISFYNTFSKSI